MAVDALRVGFALHSMGVAGAEVLVAEILKRAGDEIEPTILCLDEVGQLGETLRERGVEVLALGRRAGLDLRLPGRIARLATARRLDLIHAHQYTPFFYSALARMRPGSSFRLILTEHGRHFPDVVSWRRRWANRWLLDRQASAITGCSDFSRRGLAEVDGFSAERIELIPNGVELGRYGEPPGAGLRARLGLPEEKILVACVARFHPVKDHATLLRAFGRVAGEREDVELVLAGDGELRDELRAQAAALGVEDRVHWLGVRRDVPELLRGVDIFCMTSVSEAASLTVLEAMASRLPVVVTAVGGNPELVRDEVDGRLVPRGDDRAAAAAILDLCDDAELARSVGEAGRQRVEAVFDLEVTLDAYLALYQRVARGADL